MAKMLSSFAMGGQGLGGRSKKAGVAQGGSPNADDQSTKAGFSSGTATPSRAAMSNPRLDQRPVRLSNSSSGVSGTSLPVGRSSRNDALTTTKLKSASRGASGALPLGQGGQTAPIARKLKNTR